MKKTIKVLLILVAAIALLLAGGRWAAFWYLEKTLVARIDALPSSGVTIDYTLLDVSPWAGDLRITGLAVHWPGKDSSCHSGAVIPEISVEGIHLLPLLVKNELIVNSLILSRPQIAFSKHPPQVAQKASMPGLLKGIALHIVRIDSGTLTLINERCETALTSTLDITINQFRSWGLGGDSLRWKVGDAEAKSIEIHLPTEFYRFSVQKFTYSGSLKSVGIDSIRMVPTLDELAFAQRSGHQIDQITWTIPHLGMHGVTISERLPTSLAIRQVDLGFSLHVYRDKRFPGIPGKPRILPRAFMHQLPLSLRIDSVKLSGSSITYMEVPEAGGTPGSIRFNGLAATISNITTDSTGESVMQIGARFMDAGSLDARFTFPMTPGHRNTVRATLSDFSLPAINGMLLPLANLEIQSGHLHALELAFQYDDLQATGELKLRYTDLNVRSIRQNHKRSTNRMVTFLINTMVQNNMDRSDNKAKRTGVILWHRSPQSGILSYWWKSVLSGLRSVYSLDSVLSI